MCIAFVDKGSSGKTISAALFSRYLAARGLPVMAIDADINRYLAQALGHEGPLPPAMGAATRPVRSRRPHSRADAE